MHYVTPDLCDAYPELVQVVKPMFSNFGGRDSFGGEIVTIGSDAHAPERIAADFDRACSILKKCGFRYHAIFRKRKPTFELI